jgi:isopentenyl-diphosphate delta-isomerase
MIKSIVPNPLTIVSTTCRTLSTISDLAFLDKYDPQQVTLLYEPLMIVDRQDRIIGQATKKDAHLLSNIEHDPPLIHRAFSFFLFDSSTLPSRLILQQRSPEKITYPSLWANTCCSHPLYNNIEMNGLDGVKHAVSRRVKYELGYEFPLDLIYLTRIFYQARNIPDDGIFGESEIDYIILAKHHLNSKLDLLTDFQLNTNEVKQIKSVTLKECEDFVQQGVTTPWFTKIVREGLLAKWWSVIDGQKDEQGSDEIIQL